VTATVVVPTRDRPEALRRCLAAVRAQRHVQLDIVVVDDGSRSSEQVSAVAGEFAARVVRLEGKGPAAARNAGARVVATDRVLLLDDDCVPRAGWAAALVGDVPHLPREVVAGGVERPRSAPVWLRASERLAVSAEREAGFFRTLNLSCGADFLREVPFDETFPGAAGEDRDWCFRAEAAGAVFVREPGAIVVHCAEMGARAFLRQQLRYGRAVDLLRRRGSHVAVPARARRRGLLDGFGDGALVGATMVAGQAVVAVGYLLERWSRRPR